MESGEKSPRNMMWTTLADGRMGFKKKNNILSNIYSI
jgi:hypothetical protein